MLKVDIGSTPVLQESNHSHWLSFNTNMYGSAKLHKIPTSSTITATNQSIFSTASKFAAEQRTVCIWKSNLEFMSGRSHTNQ
jgi:hypothetical protein